MSEVMEQLLPATEVAKLYRIHPRSTYRAAREGKIPMPVLDRFNRKMWRASEVNADLKSMQYAEAVEASS